MTTLATPQRPTRLPPVFPGFENPDSAGKYPPLHLQLPEFIRASFLDSLGDPAERQATEETERLRELCRNGNPFPLIAHQWPFLVIPPESPDHDIFRDNLKRIDEAKITDAMRAAILHSDNPILRLDWWQYIIIAGFFDSTIGEVSVKGATGTGKGSSVGMGVCLWFDAYGNSRIHLTGRDHQHTLDNIFREGVVKWRVQMEKPMEGRLTSRSIEGENSDSGGTNYIHTINPSISSSTAGEKFSGAHGENTLYVFDECTAHPDSFFKMAAKNARAIIKLANPRTMAGQFRRDFEALDDINSIGIVPGVLRMRLCVTVGGPDCINVARERLKEPVGPKGGITIGDNVYDEGQLIAADDFERVKLLIPNQIDLAKFRSIIASPDKRVEVPVFGYGRFPDEDPESQVVLSSWLSAHENHFYNLVESGVKIPVNAVGVDVGRSLDSDPSVIAPGSEIGIAAFHELHCRSTIGVARWVCGTLTKKHGVNLREGKIPVVVDATGIGSGVVDQLREMGVWVIEFYGNATADINSRLWANLRTQVYATLGGRLDPSGPFSEISADYDPARDGPLVHSNPWAIPASDRFRREITAPEKKFAGDMIRFGIEPKDLIKQKLNGQSPDYADAATYLWHAVTVFRNLQSYFASYSGPLTVWPQPNREQAEWLQREDEKRAAKIRQDRDSAYAGLGIDLSNAVSDNAETADGEAGQQPGARGQQGPASPTLDWLRQRYGGGGDDVDKFSGFFGE